jgi:DNA-binding protein H-NS
VICRIPLCGKFRKKFMGITEKLQGKKEKMEQEVRARIEEFNSLVSVYLQASFASQLGILDLRMLPQLKIFKHKFNLMTQGRLGNAEKAFVSKLMINE